MQVSNTFTVNVIFCPLKENTWRFKNISCSSNEPKQCTTTWQIIEVSNSMKQHTDNSGNHADLWPLARSYGSNFCLYTIRSALHKQEWSNKKGWETEKWTANVQMARTVGAVFGRLFYLPSLQNSPTHPSHHLPLAEAEHMINHTPDKTTYPPLKKQSKI